MMKKLLAVLLPALLLAMAGTSSASPTVLFSDSFDGYASPVLNWNGGGVWNVTDGKVDLIGKNGITFYDLLPGNGMYVDLDGDGDPGVLATNATFTLLPGVTYTLQFEIAGNQGATPGLNPSAEDTVRVTLGSFTADIVVPQEQGFELVTINIVGDGSAGALKFENLAGVDKQGALLDDVSLMVNVPAPGAVILGSLGVGLVGWLRRRRTL